MTTAFDLQFSEVNAAALRLFPGLLYQWFPGGVMHGDEYDVRNPLRDDRTRGSFRINITTGQWGDFATDLRGKSPISLYAQFFCDGNHPEAARQIARQIGMLNDAPPDPVIARLIENLKAKPAVEDPSAEAGWTQIPVSVDALIPPLPAGCPAWTYYTADGQLLGYVARIQKADGGKRFLPVTYWRNAEGVETWRHKQFVRPLPIYNRQVLWGDPQRPVLIVEGEKAADAGNLLFVDMAVISWPQGSSSAAYVDWTELRGRQVALLPDHDEPGRQAMRKIADKLMALGCSVHIGAVEDYRPVGWDVADGRAAQEWVDEKAAQIWLDRLNWQEQTGQPGAEAATVLKTHKDERLERAMARAAGKGPQYAPQAIPLIPIEPIPIPLLAQFEAELNRRVHIAHPLAAQQTALSVAAHACARQAISTSNDPCSLYLALCAQSVGDVRPYLSLAHDLFTEAGLRETVRQQRISTTSGLHKLLYTHPALLYLSSEYGVVVQRAKYQPAGSLEQALNTLAELYDAANVSIDPREFGIKDVSVDQDLLRSPTVNLLALLSQDQMASVVKASELGRGALEQLQVVVLDEDRQIMNEPDSVQTGPFDPALIAMLRRLRRAGAGPLALTQGFDPPEQTLVRLGADMKAVYPALDELMTASTRAARPLIIAARAIIRRVATVLAVWANPDTPVITPELLGWATRREVARLKTFLARFELLTSDDGKSSIYQKVLAAINDAKHHGLSSRELQRNCWAFRSLGLEARADLMKALVDDGEIIDLIPNGKRATSYFGRLFVNTTEASS